MDPSIRKRLLLAGAAAVIALAVAVVVLVSQAGKIVQNRLEQALGENFAVESIALSWNRVEVIQPRFMKDGRVTAQARRIVLEPEILSLLKSGLAVSSILLEEPSLALEIDKSGRLVMPVEIGGKTDSPSETKPMAVSIGRVEITDGTFVFQDHSRPAPNRVELRKLHARLDHLAYPLESRPSSFDVRMEVAGSLVSGSVSGSGAIGFDTRAVSGKFEGRDLVFLDGGGDGPVSRVGKLSFTAASEGGKNPLRLSDLTLVNPYLRLRTDRQGKSVSPLPGGPPEKAGAKEKDAGLTVEVKSLRIEGGELLYLDGKIARPPHPVRVTDIELTADQLAFPADDRVTAFRLEARLPGSQGTGRLTASGTTALASLDTAATAALRNLDLTAFKPYIRRKGDVDITRGFIDLDVDLGVQRRMLRAPARSVLRDLRFAGRGGLTDRFLGVPRDLVVNALSANGNRIEIDFVVEGSLDNPTFSLRESMITRLTIALARTLGLSAVESGGQAIIQGGRILKGVGDIMKELTK
ncbi:MAG TPA: DUF748 domain-containing protein [Syntrophales bacterium]|nr:DUF748 domain-containing protein [Syntrophales bacterium]